MPSKLYFVSKSNLYIFSNPKSSTNFPAESSKNFGTIIGVFLLTLDNVKG